MNWFKYITSCFIISQLALSPLLAQAKVRYPYKNSSGKQEPIVFGSHYNPAVQSYKVINKKTQEVLVDLNIEAKETLTTFSPDKLNKKLKADVEKLKRAQKEGTFVQTIKSFPMVTTMFFMALGGLTALQLFTDFANNPVGMKQHIENQLSPVAQIGLFIFMYTQGVTTNVLNAWLKRPSLGIPINGLGMTAGYMMQTYFSQVVTDPNIQKCARSLFTGGAPEGEAHPCSEAYKYFVVDKKILQGPGIASLLGAFFIEVAFKTASTQVLKKFGIDIALMLATGGTGGGLRFIIKTSLNGLNIAAFTVVQLKLEHIITNAWMNYFDGKEFVGFNDDIVADIEAQKRTQWTAKKTQMPKRLEEFSAKMSEWRTNNLSEAYMASVSWNEFLMNLTAMYNASYDFYSEYVPHLLEEGSFIDRTYPLHGVTPKDLSPGHDTHFHLRPERIERLQTDTTLDVAAWVWENIQNGYYKNLGFNKEQYEAVVKIQSGLANEDIDVKGQAILELNSLIVKHSRTIVGSMEFGRELVKIRNMLGNPDPMFEKGRGYAAGMKLSTDFITKYKEVNFDKISGRFATPSLIDYFIVQMICGPETDRNEKVVGQIRGFPAKFIPPALALDNGDKDSLCFGASTQPWPQERLYNLPIVQQKTAPEYLRANLDPEIKKGFVAWWVKGTEVQLRETFRVFSLSYNEIIAKLFKGLNNTQISPMNRGFISNGVMVAAFQEMRLYSMILGELLKDTYRIQNKKTLPTDYFDPTPEKKVELTAVDYDKSKKPLLALLRQASRYDFNTLVSADPNGTTYSLKIQKDLENQFLAMNELIQKARKRPKKTLLKSEDLEIQKQRIEDQLVEFSKILGVNAHIQGQRLQSNIFLTQTNQNADPTQTHIPALVQLSD